MNFSWITQLKSKFAKFDIVKFITDVRYRIIVWNYLGAYKHRSDESHIKKLFYARMGKRLNLEHPYTFNEKLQWLKLYDRKQEYTTMVDKYAVKKYVADKIGAEYIIPTLGVWDKFDDIDFDILPDQFVLKCTHDCASIVICTDKSKFDMNAAKEKINKCLKRNFFLPWAGVAL